MKFLISQITVAYGRLNSILQMRVYPECSHCLFFLIFSNSVMNNPKCPSGSLLHTRAQVTTPRPGLASPLRVGRGDVRHGSTLALVDHRMTGAYGNGLMHTNERRLHMLRKCFACHVRREIRKRSASFKQLKPGKECEWRSGRFERRLQPASE